MPLLATDAVVLHAFDYLESSRILRLATREAGVQSVIAKGARRSRTRFGSAVDLFAEGAVQLYTKPGRELHTLASFEVERDRAALALDLGRFAGASAIAELVLRFVRDDSNPALYDTIVTAFDEIAAASPERARAAALASAWRIVAELGFAPSLEVCSACHTRLDDLGPVLFSHPAGGALCVRCARGSPGRPLPAEARRVLRAWIAGSDGESLDAAAARAHQRLLREFLREHLTDGQVLRAFEVWEREELEHA